MKKLNIFLILLSLTLKISAQPGSEIYVFDLTIKRDKIVLENPQNITHHKGYDNQPFFHPQNSVMYYVSADEEGRTDIIEYNYQSKESKKFTQTHDKEYSPTVTPDKKFISCILQSDSGLQNLVKYPINGGEPEILIDNLIVGYHAWADESKVLVFTLPQPFKLQMVDLAKKETKVITENIGRSLQKIPGKKAVSFLQKKTDTEWDISSFDAEKMQTSLLAKSLPGNEHFMTWTSDGIILMSDDKKIFFLQPGKSNEWKEVEIKSSVPLNTFTRLAVNSKGDKIAIVVAE